MAAEPLRRPETDNTFDVQERGYDITAAGRVVVDPGSLFRSPEVQEIFQIAERIVAHGVALDRKRERDADNDR